MVQLWLLIVCLLLFNTMGVDTLTCRNCMSMWPMAPCLPLNGFCVTSVGVCGHLQVFGSMRLEKLILTCLENEQNNCGSFWEDPKTHFRYKLSCCSDHNSCNWKPFFRPWKYFKSPANIIPKENKNNRRRRRMKKKPTPNSSGSSATI